MNKEDMMCPDNIISTHEHKGILYNLFVAGDKIGWISTIKDNDYGNFISSKNIESIVKDNENLIHANAKASIDVILTKS